MALDAAEIAQHLPKLIGLRDELNDLLDVVNKAREDGDITPKDRRDIRRSAGVLLRVSTPILAALAIDIVD